MVSAWRLSVSRRGCIAKNCSGCGVRGSVATWKVQEFDELLIEKNRYGAVWLHFAVRPKENRHKVAFINA